MGKIYAGQTKLDIVLTTGQDITGATETTIKYRKPDNTTGSFTATITDATNGVITYAVANTTDIDVTGTWCFWAYIVFADGRFAAGEKKQINIYSEESC